MDDSELQRVAKMARTDFGLEHMAELAASPLMTSMASPMPSPSPLPTMQDLSPLEVRIKGAVSRDGAFNGVVCTLIKFDAKSGRWSVQLPALHGGARKMIQRKNLDLLLTTCITQSGDWSDTALYGSAPGLTAELLNAEPVPIQKRLLCQAFYPRVARVFDNPHEAELMQLIANIIFAMLEADNEYLLGLLESERRLKERAHVLWLTTSSAESFQASMQAQMLRLEDWIHVLKRQDSEACSVFDTVMAGLQFDINGRLKSSMDQTPLFYAARYSITPLVRHLLKREADVEARDAIDQTPLFYAAKFNVANVGTLLKQRADPNAIDKRKQTPLHYTSSTDVVKQLVKARADANIEDRSGFTALELLCRSRDFSVWPSHSMVQALMEVTSLEVRVRHFMRVSGFGES